MTRPRGTVILKSTVHGTVAVDTAPIIVNELTLVGSRCGRFEAALPLLSHPLVRVEEMIADRFPSGRSAAGFRPRGRTRRAESAIGVELGRRESVAFRIYKLIR